MDSSQLQQQLFRHIKSILPANISLADDLAAVLKISTDSAYRRIRGEKPISVDELFMLCSHYQISFDQFLNVNSDTIIFQGRNVDTTSFRFDQYLKDMLRNVIYINSFKRINFIYLCKDIPVFHHFHFREIAAFKYHFWLKTIFTHPEFVNRKIDFEKYPEEIFELGNRNLHQYNIMDTVELWNVETMNSTIRQIDYYRDMNMFQSNADVLIMYETLEKLIGHLEQQAELGFKFRVDDPERKPLGKFQVYINEVILGDNSILVELDDAKLTYLIHNVANFMVTRDREFCDYTYNSLQNLMRKSTLISSTGEKERSRFFKRLRDKIARRKNSLK